MDKIKFEYSFDKELTISNIEEIEIYLNITTYINDEIFFPDLCINIFCLEESLEFSGMHTLFTCECGSEGCAGISENPYVIINNDIVTWHIFQPKQYTLQFSKKELLNEINTLKSRLLNDKNLEEWEKIKYTPCSCIYDFLKKMKKLKKN